MFSKGKKNTTPTGSGVKRNCPPSMISSDLVITGNLASEGEIQIDGTIEGDIKSHDLLVGETALIKGEITAENLTVHGKIVGQIRAKNVKLAKTAHVVGDILHSNLSIDTGAFLEGLCKRLEESEIKTETKPAETKENKDSAATKPVSINKKATA